LRQSAGLYTVCGKVSVVCFMLINDLCAGAYI